MRALQGKIDKNEDVTDELCRHVQQGFDINQTDPERHDYTLMHAAAVANNSSAINSLLARGAAADLKDRKGYTPLHRAIQMMHTDCARILLNRTDVDINTTTMSGVPLIETAMLRGLKSIAEELLKRNYKLDILTSVFNKYKDTIKDKNTGMQDVFLLIESRQQEMLSAVRQQTLLGTKPNKPTPDITIGSSHTPLLT